MVCETCGYRLDPAKRVLIAGVVWGWWEYCHCIDPRYVRSTHG